MEPVQCRTCMSSATRFRPHLAVLCFGILLGWRNGFAQHTKCSILEGDQVSNNYSTLDTRVSSSTYVQGKQIRVVLVLTAGPKGAYLPAYFDAFVDTCQTGFAASLLTPGGKAADLKLPGCAASILHSTTDTAQGELKHFVHLKPGETRTWQTTIETMRIKPGHYCLYSEYLSFAYMIDEVARLPEVEGMMAKGRITAPPLPIEIR